MRFISSKVSQKSFDIEFILLSRVLRSLSGGIITIAFPYLLLKDLHYSPFLLGIIYTAATISTALLSLASGYIADLWNQKYTLIFTLLLLPLSSLIILLFHNIIFIFLAAVLGGYTGTLAGGVTGGAAIPLMNALVSDLVNIQGRVKVFSKLMFIGGISGAVGMLLGKISNTYTLFIFASVASLLSVMIMIPVRAKTKNKKANTALKAKDAIFKFFCCWNVKRSFARLDYAIYDTFFYYCLPYTKISNVYLFLCWFCSSGICSHVCKPFRQKVWFFKEHNRNKRLRCYTNGFFPSG